MDTDNDLAPKWIDAQAGQIYEMLAGLDRQRGELMLEYARLSLHLPAEQIRWDFGRLQRGTNELLLNTQMALEVLYSLIRTLQVQVKALGGDSNDALEEPV
jgi:hypothetical protein